MKVRLTQLDGKLPNLVPMIEGTPYRADCDVSRVAIDNARPCSMEPGVAPATWVTPDTMDEPRERYCQQYRSRTVAECWAMAFDLDHKAAAAMKRADIAQRSFDSERHVRSAQWCWDRAQAYRHASAEGRTFDHAKMTAAILFVDDGAPADWWSSIQDPGPYNSEEWEARAA